MEILTAYYPNEEEKNEITLDKELGNVYYGDGVIADIQLIVQPSVDLNLNPYDSEPKKTYLYRELQ